MPKHWTERIISIYQEKHKLGKRIIMAMIIIYWLNIDIEGVAYLRINIVL